MCLALVVLALLLPPIRLDFVEVCVGFWEVENRFWGI
jgi:hypothetical protein